MNDKDRARICGERYRQRRTAGKPGWADESSYEKKRAAVDKLLASPGLPSRCRFLELGCGNGNVTLHVAGKGHEAHGIDLAPEAIQWATDQAREKGLPAHFALGSVVTLAAYADETFDVVFDANCFFMIIGGDRKTCVSNVFRVLKEGGHFLVEAHLVDETVRSRVAINGQDYFDPEGQYSTVQGQPMYYYSREQEFVDLLEGAGFRIIRREIEPRYETHQEMTFCAGGMSVVAVKP